jgi:hypothetical protein
MNSEETMTSDFASVANDFLEELEQHRGGVLEQYLDRYPEHARDLILLAAESAIDDADDLGVLTPPTHLRERLLAGAAAAWQEAAEPVLVFTSLCDRARDYADLSPKELSKKLRIGRDLLAMLDEGGINPGTILPAFLREVAQVLGLSVAAVSAFLRSASQGQNPLSVSYHAPQGHAAGTQPRVRTFEEALRESPSTSPEDKAFWLARTSGQDEL